MAREARECAAQVAERSRGVRRYGADVQH
jgi:hypothetical protein